MPSTKRQAKSLVVAGLLLLGLQTTAGCNALLGIEQAQLDETSAASECANPQAPPNTDCQPCSDSDQSECLVGPCFENHGCRDALFDFRSCVGKACSDTNRLCLGCVKENAQALAVVKCLENRGCSAAAPMTPCEEYCACMKSQCPGQAPDGIDGCVTACEQGPTATWRAQNVENDPSVKFSWLGGVPKWRAHCLWEHCELAHEPAYKHHCQHAIGKFGWCENAPIEDPLAPDCPPGTIHSGSPCNEDADCCSTRCDSGTSSCE